MIAPRWLLNTAIVLGAAILASGCSKGEPNRDELLSRGNEAFAAQQYDKAEAAYREVLRRVTTDPVATRQLGLLYHEQGEIPQAFALLKKAAELEPDNLEVQLKLGQTYFSLLSLKEAREAALRILDQQPGQEDALLLLADTAAAPKDIEDTEKLIEDLRAKDTNRPGYHLALGQLALRRNDPTKAENELKAAQQLDPNSGAMHFAWGNLYLSRKTLKEADQEFRTAADLSPLRSLRRLRYAEFKLQTSGFTDARSVLEEFTAKAPDYLPLRVSLMKIACAQRHDDCTARIKNILNQDQFNFDALFISGNLSLQIGDTAKALREFEQLSNLYPRNASVRYWLAVAYLQKRHDSKVIDKAISSLNLALSLNPGFDQATLLLAEVRIRNGQYAAAIDALEPIIRDRPVVAQAHLLLAQAYLAQHDIGQALAAYRRMAEIYRNDPQPHFLAGIILDQQRKEAEARQEFEKSLELSPDYLPAIEQLVDLDLAKKQYATAMERVEKHIDKNPSLPRAFAVRAKIYLVQRDFPHAEADLLKAIDLDPNLEQAYILLAGLYVATNRQEQAVEKLKTFVAQHEGDLPTLMQLGRIQELLGRYDAARDAYEKSLAVNPKFLPALNNLAYIYSERLGRLDGAYELAKRAREVAPSEPHTADTLGWILFQKGQYGDALPLLQESANRLTGEAEIQFHLGMAHYMLGEDGPARLALQKAADADKEFPGKDEVGQRLGILNIEIHTAGPAVQEQLRNYLSERPNDPVALVRLAGLQQRDGAVDQAIKTYEKIVDVYPQFSPAIRELALLGAHQSPYQQKTYELLTKARQAYPEDPDVARTLAVINYRRGLYIQSAELLNQLAIKHKDDPEILYYLGMSHYHLKQYSEAEGELQRALEMNLPPPLEEGARSTLADPEIAKTLGMLNYRDGRYVQAIEQLQKVADRRADDPELLYYLGMSYYQLKQAAKAKGLLERALTLTLPPKLAEEVKRMLSEIYKLN